jgi:hypothetical protein
MATTEDLIKTLKGDLVPLKCPCPYQATGRWFLGLFAYVVAASCVALRDDFAVRLHSILFLSEIGVLTLLIITSALAALFLSVPDLRQRRQIIFAPIPVLGILIGVLVLEGLQNIPFSPRPDGIRSLAVISILSLPPAAFLFYQMRKFASTHYCTAGATALLTAYSSGNLITRMSENTNSIPYIVEWHYLPMVGVALIGAMLGRVLLKW